MKRWTFFTLLACVPFLWAAYVASSPPERVHAYMDSTAHFCGVMVDCGSAEHLMWNYLYESDSSITNCDDSSFYGHCSVTTGTQCSVAISDCPVSEGCVAYDMLDEPSFGRCNLMPGVYMMTLAVQGRFSGASCISGLAIANTTTSWPSTGGIYSKIQVWMARNDYDVTDSFMDTDSGILTVTEQSWVEARFNWTCSDLTNVDAGTWLIERIADYIP